MQHTGSMAFINIGMVRGVNQQCSRRQLTSDNGMTSHPQYVTPDNLHKIRRHVKYHFLLIYIRARILYPPTVYLGEKVSLHHVQNLTNQYALNPENSAIRKAHSSELQTCFQRTPERSTASARYMNTGLYKIKMLTIVLSPPHNANVFANETTVVKLSR